MFSGSFNTKQKLWFYETKFFRQINYRIIWFSNRFEFYPAESLAYLIQKKTEKLGTSAKYFFFLDEDSYLFSI